jgi:hypothetical protein
MATIDLNRVWVNLVTTGQGVSGLSARARSEDYQVPVDIRTYAGGRRRAVTSAGELGKYAFQLMLVSRTTVSTLRTWQGQLVQVRDHKGRQFFGVYSAMTVEEVVSRSTWNVAIQLTVVTTTAGV